MLNDLSIKRILLIEDDLQCARLVRKVLEPNGYIIDHAPTALSGLKLARDTQPDIVLVDMDLPDLSGQATVVQLRGIVKGRSKPISITAFTAESGARAQRIAFGMGCDAFIAKPIDTRELPNTIDMIIKRRQPLA